MPHLSVDEFRNKVRNTPLEEIVRQHIFQGLPFAFRKKPETLGILTKHLSEALDVQEENVVVVGSGKVGFSLNPDTFPRIFSETSDIDVIVVSGELFDRVWMKLLEWHYPRRLLGLGGVERNWAGHRKRDIYWGWLVPNEIQYEGLLYPEVLKSLRDISVMWFNAFKSLSNFPDLATRTVTGRLYRTWDHALRYHIEGLRMIREKDLKSQIGG